MKMSDMIELGRGVPARLLAMDQPESVVAAEIALSAEPLAMAVDPRLLARVAHRDHPGQRAQLDCARCKGPAGGDGAPDGWLDVEWPAPE